MTEPDFLSKSPAIRLEQAAALAGATIADPAQRDKLLQDVAPLERAGPDDLTFFENRKFSESLASTRAGACLIAERDVLLAPKSTVLLITASPGRAFAVLVGHFYPSALRPIPVTGSYGVSPAAHVAPTAHLENDVSVEPGAVVGAGAEIGSGTFIGAGAVIGPGVKIGRDSTLSPGVTVAHALIGDHVVLHPGVRVGQDGFGYVPGSAMHQKIPQIGRAIIQDHVEIGANTTVDRGSVWDTIIGEGTKIDNLVQIGHNVVIGRHCLIAGQVGISGSVTIGDFVMIGGGASFRDHISIGDGARVTGMAAVHTDIPNGETWGGYPALPVEKWYRQMRTMQRLVRRASEPGNTTSKFKESADGE